MTIILDDHTLWEYKQMSFKHKKDIATSCNLTVFDTLESIILNHYTRCISFYKSENYFTFIDKEM